MNETDFINGFVRGFNEGCALSSQLQIAKPKPNTDIAPQLWIARDKDDDLYLFFNKPKKIGDLWRDQGTRYTMGVNKNHFPEVKWEDKEPRLVKLVLVDE